MVVMEKDIMHIIWLMPLLPTTQLLTSVKWVMVLKPTPMDSVSTQLLTFTNTPTVSILTRSSQKLQEKTSCNKWQNRTVSVRDIIQIHTIL